jgi:hypothetical protein
LIAGKLASLGLPAARRVLFQFGNRIDRRIVDELSSDVN